MFFAALCINKYNFMDDNLQFNLMSKSEFIGQHNVDIEEVVLATFVNYPESYFKVADQLTISEFSSTENRYIYQAVKELSEVSKIDLATVTDKLIQKKYVDVMSRTKRGFDLVVHLNNMVERVESDNHLLQHVEILNGYAKRRALTKLSQDINKDCNDMVDPQETVNRISTAIVDIQEMGDVEEFDLDKANKAVYESLEPKKAGDVLVRSHIQKMDEFLYCFEPTELVIIAAAPSMGKTALALEIFKNQITHNTEVAIFSLEMGQTQLLNRMYAVEADISLSKMRQRTISTDERSRLNTVIGGFEKKKFWIDDRSRKLSHISNRIRKFVIRHKVKLVMIDYLQLITCDMGKASNRENEVAIISREFKNLALELKIPIIALSQINRAIHQRSDKRPTLGDLRESGAIEQDADVVCFVHRPAYFNIQAGIPEIEYAELIFAKGRSTGMGTVEVAFQSSRAKFISNSYEEIKMLKHDQLGDLPNSTEFS
jgi:replicative DNA helicase